MPEAICTVVHETHIRNTYLLEGAGERMLIKELHFWSKKCVDDVAVSYDVMVVQI